MLAVDRSAVSPLPVAQRLGEGFHVAFQDGPTSICNSHRWSRGGDEWGNYLDPGGYKILMSFTAIIIDEFLSR